MFVDCVLRPCWLITTRKERRIEDAIMQGEANNEWSGLNKYKDGQRRIPFNLQCFQQHAQTTFVVVVRIPPYRGVW